MKINYQRCDNGSCYNELLIEEQALELQKRETELSNIKEDLSFEIEVKAALKTKLKSAMDIIEDLYNIDTLDPDYDRSWIDQVYREASMFLQNNRVFKDED